MSKQILITQGDYGIVLQVSLLNENKEPLEILDGDFITAHIQYPSGDCIQFNSDYITITDKLKGIVRLSLEEEYTKEEGYYQIFIELKSDNYTINAKQSIGYYVNAKHNIGEH